MKEVLLQEYSNLKKVHRPFKIKEFTFDFHYVDGPLVEIKGSKKKEFLVKMINQDQNTVLYETTITTNMWTQSNIKYFVNWKIEVYDKETKELVAEDVYNAKNKRVYIHLDSKALGDTLAWFPYIEEFRKEHQCEVITSTFHNHWFESQYPNLTFVKPGTRVYNLYAKYPVGWHYNDDNSINYLMNPTDFRTQGLQETSSGILGTTIQEIKPKLSFQNTGKTIQGKYVCIAPHASAHAKYWNCENGWQSVIDYLKSKDYKVVMITQEPLGDEWHDSKLGGTLTGVIDKTGDYSLEDRANDLMNADLFIGLGSGLSWLSWALDTPTVLISGFSKPYSEFKGCSRVFTPSLDTCNGCFNKTRLDAGDWEWCPNHKNTDRQFECTKTITPQIVINAIKNELLKEK